MNVSKSIIREAATITEGREIDRLCDAFEAALKRGEQPSIPAMLEQADKAVHSELFAELLALELDYRMRRGQAPTREEYFQAWPQFDAEIVSTFGILEADANSRSAESGDRSGEQLGPFQLLENVGSGSFGAVYRAHDSRLDRTVAIKIPVSCVLEGEARQRFLREAQAAAGLRHPHIVQVHEVHDGDTCYIVSDFIDGPTLSESIAQRPVKYTEAASLVAKLAQASDYANAMGVVHRDLKPENIILDGASQPLITDFGLAKKEEDDALRTQEGVVLVLLSQAIDVDLCAMVVGGYVLCSDISGRVRFG